MTNEEFLDPPIEVLAASPRLEMIKSRLKSAGMRPYTARAELHADDPLLIDAASVSADQLRHVRKQIARESGRPMVLLAAGGVPLLTDTITLSGDAEIGAVPMRLAVLRRRKDRESEGKLRIRTAETISSTFVRHTESVSPRVLFVGDGSSRFLALTAALKSRAIPVTAAFTALTANAYLEGEIFASVVVCIDDGSQSAFDFLHSFADDYLRSCVPVFALIHNRQKRSAAEQAALSNATEIIDASLPIQDAAARIATLAEYHASITPIRPGSTTDKRINDRATGLFTAEFLEQHLRNQLEVTRHTLSPLSFMTLQMTPRPESHLEADTILAHVARISARHLRETDCAGRLDTHTIGISLRHTSYAGGVTLARRIMRDLVETTTQEHGYDLYGETELSWRIVEKRRYHSAHDLITSGKTGPKAHIVTAA